jgi:integrase
MRAFFASVDDQITEAQFGYLATYWLSSNRKRLSAKTIGRHLCSLKAYAMSFGIEAENLYTYRLPTPLKSDPHPIPEGIPGVLRMIEATDDEQHKCIIAFCGLAGLRIAEALAVRASHIDMHARTLLVRGKGDKMRRVPISEKLWEIVVMRYYWSLCDKNSLLIEIGNRSARRAVSMAAERADLVRHVASHDLRATFATAVYNKTHNSRIVQELLGHSSVSITETYLGIDAAEFKEAVDL